MMHAAADHPGIFNQGSVKPPLSREARRLRLLHWLLGIGVAYCIVAACYLGIRSEVQYRKFSSKVLYLDLPMGDKLVAASWLPVTGGGSGNSRQGGGRLRYALPVLQTRRMASGDVPVETTVYRPNGETGKVILREHAALP